MLRFEPEGHRYYWNDREIPSVTTVLQELEFNSFLARIKEAMRNENAGHVDETTAFGRALEVWRAAAEFGTHVHQAIHLYNEGDLHEPSLSPALVPFVNAYKQFLSDTGFVVRGAEVLVYHNIMKYAGQVDFWGDFRKTSWAVDIKSGVVPITVGPQTAAYQQGLPEKPRKRACLQLTAEGRYKWIPLEDPADFSMFVSSLNIFRFKEKHNPNRRAPTHVSESA